MARYTPEFLAALRHRYEKTDQPMRALAAEFGIGISTLGALVEKEGWAKRSQRARDCPQVLNLLAQAKALAAAPRAARDRAFPAADPAPPVTAHAEISAAEIPSSAVAESVAAPIVPGAEGNLSPAERLEALVVRYIAVEEAAQAELKTRPRTRGEAEHCARTLSTLTQTLRTLQAMKASRLPDHELTDDDDMPADIDAFRLALARRIDAFVASRPDEADAACVRPPDVEDAR